MRFTTALVVILFSSSVALPCSFCGDGFAKRQTFRSHFNDAKLVVAGVLKNPKANADGLGGTTEFHVTNTLKAADGVDAKVIIIPRYLPIIGATPADYLFFCAITDGKIDPVHGVASSGALEKYLTTAAKLPGNKPAESLAFFFAHLDSHDEAISNDAFLEFAKASDADLTAAAKAFDRTKLRTWIADAKVPEDRLGVYALLLGLNGTADDAAWLTQQLTATPRPERYSTHLGGLLAGLTVLDPARGWPLIQKMLADKECPFIEKLSLLGTLRFFQTTRPKESHEQILAACKVLLKDGDFADLAMDDLRRWGWWDLTDMVLANFGQPGFTSPMARRGIVRYALTCPNAEAKAFVEKVKLSDAKLVATVEASLKIK
ncbi:hypothetical protein BH11PLA2_BH11PLA2_08410 [soil metagenome]